MARRLFWPVVAAAAAALSVLPARADESYTTRIEPRNVYGATVTIEEGVRVFRPLPSERERLASIRANIAPQTMGFTSESTVTMA